MKRLIARLLCLVLLLGMIPGAFGLEASQDQRAPTALDQGSYTIDLSGYVNHIYIYDNATTSAQKEALDNTLIMLKRVYGFNSSGSLYDLNKDGNHDIAENTFNGKIAWDRNSGTQTRGPYGSFNFNLSLDQINELNNAGKRYFGTLVIKFPGRDLGTMTVDLTENQLDYGYGGDISLMGPARVTLRTLYNVNPKLDLNHDTRNDIVLGQMYPSSYFATVDRMWYSVEGKVHYKLPGVPLEAAMRTGQDYFSEIDFLMPDRDFGTFNFYLAGNSYSFDTQTWLQHEALIDSFLGLGYQKKINIHDLTDDNTVTDKPIDLDKDGHDDVSLSFQRNSDGSFFWTVERLSGRNLSGTYELELTASDLMVIQNKGSGYAPVFSRLVFHFDPMEYSNPFVDVKISDWFYAPVIWAVNQYPQVTAGTDKTHFSPNATCTRAQVVTFLWRTFGSPLTLNYKNPFTDVSEKDYYYGAVLWAVKKGITSGKSSTKFAPDEGCTRGQVVTFLWRSAGEPKPGTTSNPFKDVKSTDYWYEAVLWAVEYEVTQGISTTKFGPNDTCTRGQIVTFLDRAFGPKG